MGFSLSSKGVWRQQLGNLVPEGYHGYESSVGPTGICFLGILSQGHNDMFSDINHFIVRIQFIPTENLQIKRDNISIQLFPFLIKRN